MVNSIYNRFASVTRGENSKLVCIPDDVFAGVTLSDRRMQKVFTLYCKLLTEQYVENNKKAEKEYVLDK